MSPANKREESQSLATHRRLFAMLAYILPLVGGIIGLAADRANPLTRIHAQQSIAAVLVMILSFIVWVVVGYLVGLIPIAGPIIAVSLFSLVIAMFIFLVMNWIISLAVAMRGQERTIPFANRLVKRLFGKPKSAEVGA